VDRQADEHGALALFFGAFVAFSATQMLLNNKAGRRRARCPARGGMFAAGGVIGVLAGLVGAGGGFVSCPS
jgi:uncharacterized membrane protein YfcA